MTMVNKHTNQVEYGDYQTPVNFAYAVCNKLKNIYSLSPSVVIEPTFGTGNFIDGTISSFNRIRSFFGIEINPQYFNSTLTRFSNIKSLSLFNADIFSFDFTNIKEKITNKDELLIVGNPPWVTNTQLSSMNSYNLPLKENFKGYSGLDAITGKGNFDVAEYIILQLLSEFKNFDCTLAMLCKTIVAKNIMRDMEKYSFSISSADMFVFDATEIFDVSCDAALLVIRLGRKSSSVCNVYDFDTDTKIRKFGWNNGMFYSDISDSDNHISIDGKCQFEWRQGIKHDCSKVMELNPLENNLFRNGLNETIELSVGKYVFPLLKSSDIKSFEICDTRKYVVVPQHQVNENTSAIEFLDNEVWQYLKEHENFLDSRRSVIYKKAPKFSIFGIGNYSFAKYKVGVSGFYKEPVFALIHNEYPVMLDDTCYFIGFDNLIDAVITTALLNHPICKSFLKSIAFLDSKRPYTKEVLKRIDIQKLSEAVSYDCVLEFAIRLGKGYRLTEEQYQKYLADIRCESSNQLNFLF